MGMSFNVTIAYAIEIPDVDTFEQYATDGLEIFGECEAGDRNFLGKHLHYTDVHHCVSSEVRASVRPEIANRLSEIAKENGLNAPAIWSIGAVS